MRLRQTYSNIRVRRRGQIEDVHLRRFSAKRQCVEVGRNFCTPNARVLEACRLDVLSSVKFFPLLLLDYSPFIHTFPA
ncbi:unnamed protein product [Anisakis simplex]|uniref:Uncharacterized protein n=1 Tax=Anisakis simplex TaxID=6269 RepID=A0A0M3KIX2_ANISI|nr:unnamed protein product [Anisakis simplex]